MSENKLHCYQHSHNSYHVHHDTSYMKIVLPFTHRISCKCLQIKLKFLLIHWANISESEMTSDWCEW
jgi:hypothetical protein